jgi:hypothetical protein
MGQRIRRKTPLTEAEKTRLRAVRAEFSQRPSLATLLKSGEYVGPMSLDEYLSWRQGAGDVPLTRQLQAAIAATGQSLYSISQATGVAAPILQRFVNGERGITLDTAGKLAEFLGLSLLPNQAK